MERFFFHESEEDILVPIRIDITHKGLHYIDSFTWNIFNSILTVEEFAMKLCSDMNFPITCVPLITRQMQQQIDSYYILFSLLYHQPASSYDEIIQHLQSVIVELNIRQNVLEYADTFQYNLQNMKCCTPEKFAQITCSDLGLPPEMEPTIAFQIREAFIRNLLKSIEESYSSPAPVTVTDIVSTINLGLISCKNSVEMSTTLWKDLKPASVESEVGGQLPVFPENDFSNYNIWQNE